MRGTDAPLLLPAAGGHRRLLGGRDTHSCVLALRAEHRVRLEDARAGHIHNRSGDPYKPATLRGYEKNLRLRALPALGDRRLADIQPKDVQELLDTLKRQGASASTIDTTLTPLKAIRECDRGKRLVVEKVGIEQELAQTVRPFLRRVSS